MHQHCKYKCKYNLEEYIYVCILYIVHLLYVVYSKFVNLFNLQKSKGVYLGQLKITVDMVKIHKEILNIFIYNHFTNYLDGCMYIVHIPFRLIKERNQLQTCNHFLNHQSNSSFVAKKTKILWIYFQPDILAWLGKKVYNSLLAMAPLKKVQNQTLQMFIKSNQLNWLNKS